MKWISVTERLPVGCKHRMFWDAKNKIEVFRAYDQADPMLNKLPPHYTHWLEVTGPEDCCEWTPLHRDESGNPQFYKTKTCGYRTEKQFIESNYCPNCGRAIKEVKQ